MHIYIFTYFFKTIYKVDQIRAASFKFFHYWFFFLSDIPHLIIFYVYRFDCYFFPCFYFYSFVNFPKRTSTKYNTKFIYDKVFTYLTKTQPNSHESLSIYSYLTQQIFNSLKPILQNNVQHIKKDESILNNL
jgi:hypothetical protein